MSTRASRKQERRRANLKLIDDHLDAVSRCPYDVEWEIPRALEVDEPIDRYLALLIDDEDWFVSFYETRKEAAEGLAFFVSECPKVRPLALADLDTLSWEAAEIEVGFVPCASPWMRDTTFA